MNAFLPLRLRYLHRLSCPSAKAMVDIEIGPGIVPRHSIRCAILFPTFNIEWQGIFTGGNEGNEEMNLSNRPLCLHL
jgi:hypothetical protein